MANAHSPLLPDFDGPCLVNLVPALFTPAADRPSWFPAEVGDAGQVVLLVLDGLGHLQLEERRALAPTLWSAARSPLTSVAPSTTATALTSITTGLPPAVHGMVGYRVQRDGGVMNLLRWQLGGHDARQRVPARSFQTQPAFPGAPGDGAVPVVARADFAATGFTAAHLSGVAHHPWHTASGLVVEVRSLLAEGAPFVYAYYDGIDKVAHAKGLGAHYEAELAAVDQLVGDLAGALPPGAALVVTADHGQVDVGPSTEVLPAEVMDGVTLLSGEGRFRWLHTAPEATDDVAEAAREKFADVAWVRTREQLIDEHWLGGEPVPDVADRLGDVALVPFEATAFLDPADTGELRLAARHGSLTPAEMFVPLLTFAGQ